MYRKRGSVLSHVPCTTFAVMLIGSENSFIGAGSTVWIGLAGSCQSYVMQTALIRLNPSYGIPCNQAGAVYYGGQAY